MVGEDVIEAAVAEEGSAEVPNSGRGLNPTGGLEVELPECLQVAVLVLGEEVDAHGVGEVDGGVFRAVLLAGFQAGTVVTEAVAAFGGLGGAVEEGEFTGLGVVGDDVGFTAGGFHFVKGPEFLGVGDQPFSHVGPRDVLVSGEVFLKAGLESEEEFLGLVGR